MTSGSLYLHFRLALLDRSVVAYLTGHYSAQFRVSSNRLLTVVDTVAVVVVTDAMLVVLAVERAVVVYGLQCQPIPSSTQVTNLFFESRERYLRSRTHRLFRRSSVPSATLLTLHNIHVPVPVLLRILLLRKLTLPRLLVPTRFQATVLLGTKLLAFVVARSLPSQIVGAAAQLIATAFGALATLDRCCPKAT